MSETVSPEAGTAEAALAETGVLLRFQRIYGGRVEVVAEDDKGVFHRDQLKVFSEAQQAAYAAVCERRRPGLGVEVARQLDAYLKKWSHCWDPTTDAAGGVVWARGDRIQPQAIEWLWEDRIPMGAVTILDGDPGVGKSLLLADVAARATVGFLAPDRRADEAPPGAAANAAGDVWWISGNEDPSSTIVPRIAAAGGDLSKVRFIEGADDENGPRRLRFPDDVDKLRNDRMPIPKLIVVDPLAAFCNASGTLHESTGRKALAALADFAKQFGPAIVVVRHLNRRVGVGAFERGSAGPSLLAECRSALLLAAHPDDPKKRVLASVKCNLGPSPRSLESTILAEPSGTPRLAWLEYTELAADDLVRRRKPAAEFAAKEHARAEAWLKNSLAGGPKPAQDVKTQAGYDDIPAAILRRARIALGVETLGANGHTEWRLPALGARPEVDVVRAQKPPPPSTTARPRSPDRAASRRGKVK